MGFNIQNFHLTAQNLPDKTAIAYQLITLVLLHKANHTSLGGINLLGCACATESVVCGKVDCAVVALGHTVDYESLQGNPIGEVVVRV